MRKLIVAFLLTFVAFSATAQVSNVETLQSAVTTAVTGSTFQVKGWPELRAVQVYGTTSAGSGAAEVAVQGSNDGTVWETLGTVTLTLGTAVTSGSFVSQAPWPYVRSKVNSISGTNAQVTVKVGVAQK